MISKYILFITLAIYLLIFMGGVDSNHKPLPPKFIYEGEDYVDFYTSSDTLMLWGEAAVYCGKYNLALANITSERQSDLVAYAVSEQVGLEEELWIMDHYTPRFKSKHHTLVASFYRMGNPRIVFGARTMKQDNYTARALCNSLNGRY